MEDSCICRKRTVLFSQIQLELTNRVLYYSKQVSISGLIIYNILYGQVIWCEGGICMNLLKRKMTTLKVFLNVLLFPAPAFLLLMHSHLKIFHANCGCNCRICQIVVACSFLLSSSWCRMFSDFQKSIKHSLGTQSTGELPHLWPRSLYNLEHLLIVHQSCRVKSVTLQQCCVCICWVGLLELKYFFPSKMCLFCI